MPQPFNGELPQCPPNAPEWQLCGAVLQLLARQDCPTHVALNVLISVYRFLALNNREHLPAAAFGAGALHSELMRAAVAAGEAGAITYPATPAH